MTVRLRRHVVPMQGSLDIMVQTAGGDGGGVSKGVTFVKNNIFHDAFFLKALGRCLPC